MIRLANRIANRAADLMFMAGSERVWKQRLLGKAMALLYHRVAPAGEHDFLADGGSPTITPEEFQHDIAFLQQLGARFLTFADLRQGHFPSSKEFAVLLTFDDGFRDTYERGLSLLDSLGIRATVFQTSSMVAEERCLIAEHSLYWHASQPNWSDVLNRHLLNTGWIDWIDPDPLKATWRLLHEAPRQCLHDLLTSMRRGLEEESGLARSMYPSIADLRRARDAGHEVGSHGHGHFHRSTLDDAEFEDDLAASKNRLTEILGDAPQCFSYPFNSRVAGDRERCAKYFAQLATVDGRMIDADADPLELPRFTWPGSARNRLRHRRWLLTGRI